LSAVLLLLLSFFCASAKTTAAGAFDVA
jgi:hypothetical protein